MSKSQRQEEVFYYVTWFIIISLHSFFYKHRMTADNLPLPSPTTRKDTKLKAHKLYKYDSKLFFLINYNQITFWFSLTLHMPTSGTGGGGSHVP